MPIARSARSSVVGLPGRGPAARSACSRRAGSRCLSPCETAKRSCNSPHSGNRRVPTRQARPPVHHRGYRERILKISPDWSWREAFLACWQQADQHGPSQRHERRHSPAQSEPVRTRAHRAHRATAPDNQTDNRPEPGIRTISNRTSGTLND